MNFLELPKYYWNLQMLSIIEKFKNWKTFLKNSWKTGTSFGRRSWNIGAPFGTSWKIGTLLTSWQVYWHIGTFARKSEKLARFCQVGPWAHGHVDAAGTHGTHDTRFSKLYENHIESRGNFGCEGWVMFKFDVFNVTFLFWS